MAAKPRSPPAVTNTAEVDRLLLELERNLDGVKLSLKQQELILGEVKILGRNPETAEPIFTKRGISILSRHGLDRESSNASHEALRCLANAFLLNEESRQIFVDLGYGPKTAERMKVDDRDDEFLTARILFLLTYNTQIDFEVLIVENQLADSINKNIVRHSKTYPKAVRRKSATTMMLESSMVETLKLMFNITYYYPDLVGRFTSSIEPLVSLVVNHTLPNPPLQPPTNYLLNALLNLDLKASEKKTPIGREARASPLFPYSNPESVISRLAAIFNDAIRSYDESDLDTAAAPLCTLIRRFYELAQPQMKSRMRWLLLPNDRDREKPLGFGETLSSKLLRLSCSPSLPTLRENISSLLFELSDKDAAKFVKNIGYGFAAGFLMSHNIDIPSNAMEASSSRSGSVVSVDSDINPVTGQRLSAEGRDTPRGAPMTEEEKEREAEKLFVLFERLKATGVVDVKNPVEQAVSEGRFEELE